MRVWIDPGRAAALDLTAGEIVAALRRENVQVAAGTLGQPPHANGSDFQLNVETQGRLSDPKDFANIVIRSDADGRQRSEEHPSELQSLMRIPYAVFCLKKKKRTVIDM